MLSLQLHSIFVGLVFLVSGLLSVAGDNVALFIRLNNLHENLITTKVIVQSISCNKSSKEDKKSIL